MDGKSGHTNAHQFWNIEINGSMDGTLGHIGICQNECNI